MKLIDFLKEEIKNYHCSEENVHDDNYFETQLASGNVSVNGKKEKTNIELPLASEVYVDNPEYYIIPFITQELADIRFNKRKLKFLSIIEKLKSSNAHITYSSYYHHCRELRVSEDSITFAGKIILENNRNHDHGIYETDEEFDARFDKIKIEITAAELLKN